MEYIDKLAESIVKEAIQGLATNGKRAYSGSVPMEAERLLLSKGRGRVSEFVAAAKVKAAIERLRERKEIRAPVAQYTDWVLVDRTAPPDSVSRSV
jgi:hypothetical protein